VATKTSTTNSAPKPLPLPPPNQVPHIYEEKGLGTGKVVKR
jgi:hypothetical protein